MKLRIALSCCLALAACSRDLELPDPPPTTAFLTGRVVGAVPGTAVSAPLANVQVTLLNTNISGTTDERGNFVLGPLPSGTFRVFFSTKLATGTRQRIINNVSVRTSLTNNLGDVSLQENALLTGRSLIQGRTSGNIGITIFSPGTDYVTTSADNGGYLLSNLPEGSIRATAWRPGFTPATTTDIDLQGGVVTSAVDLILEPELMSAPAGSIIGSVTVLGREDFSGVTVKAISATTREVRATVSTDTEGRFTLPSLASDLYVVTVELTGYPSARIPNLAVAGGVQLELEPIVLAVQNSGNTGTDNPIGGPSGPLFNLDGGVTQPDGGDEDGGAIGAECTIDNECASGRLCINNRCIGCSVNVQCRPGYSCQAGDCVRDCMNNDECPSGLACIAGACVGCITSSDCRDSALICNSQQRCAQCTSRTECPVGKACLPTGCGDCMNDLDCGAGAICEQGVCTAGNCHGNTDCAPNEACVGRMCTGCASDSQCRTGQLCINNACVTGNCRSVLECGTGQVCQGNQCGPCANDMQCGTGQLCLPGTNGLRCTAATCRVNGDCTGASAGLQCVNNSCQPCGTNTPCGSGQICNAQGRCVVGDCFTNLDCTGTKAGWACLGGNCTPCGTNADCGASGYVCDQGLCRVGNCVSPTDCALTGQLCVNNACVGCGAMNPCPSGQVCDSDSLCHPGNCIVTADCPAMSNLVCVNRFCSACTTDTQCGSGKLCIGGQCRVGNCRLPSDCSVAGQICAANTCSSCTTSTQCGSGQICDVDGLCHTGNCVSGSVCPGNQLCVSNVCTPCAMDTQCLGTQICFNGGCITGNCHSDADCSSGTRICDQGTHACRSCSNPGTVNSLDCGGSGRVCDLGGFCRTGNCLTTCSGGLVCVNFNCTTCTTDNQCGSGQLCVNNACKNGNCHGTGTDPNIDCAATNGVCVVTVPNNTCVGNCRGNADCAATGFCNTTTHFCGACTAAGQCGPGKVCGTGGICVTGQCSPLEPNCAGSESCVGNTCMQVGPSAQADGGGYTNPGVFSLSQRAPMVLSGNNTLYFSAYESSAPTGTGVYVTALEPNLSVRWRIRSGTNAATKDNFAGAGIVVPAPGFPNNELFVTTDGNNGLAAMAHRSDTGATVWTLPAVGVFGATFATGLANGIPQIAWLSGNVVGWMRTDGTHPRSATLTPGCGFLAFTFGTNGIYAVCAEGVYLVDPVSGAVKVVPHNGNPGLMLPNGFPTGVAAIWRPPDNYVTRGVDAGIVNSDIVIYSGSRSMAPAITLMLAVRVPDDWVTNPTSTSTWTLWANSTINANTTPTAIDSTGALYLHNAGAQFYKINVYDGSVIAASAPNNIATLWNVGANGQLISTTAGQLAGYFIGDGQTAPATPVWTLPSTPGTYPNLTPTFQATSTNFGNLLAFQGTATPNQYVLRSLAPAPTAPSFVPTWPAWSQGGDAQNHNTAPAYECTSNAQCASNETCMLGRCGGTCRDATQCPAGQGCSMVSCQACTKASQCRSGEVCWAGTCQACTGMNCCSTRPTARRAISARRASAARSRRAECRVRSGSRVRRRGRAPSSRSLLMERRTSPTTTARRSRSGER
ncbi:MAG: carboxypeptidase regulatory-like domain-containing protein [Archangium sp.]|nr:carboxypeptidase regulatory-like domain-containing protein [Archangium sp.]